MTTEQRRPGTNDRGGADDRQGSRSAGEPSNGLPVLAAYRDGACLRVWCEHEAVWHSHGGCNGTCAAARPRYRGLLCECPPGTGDGPRAAHCTCPVLRAQHADYTLREVGPFTAAVRGARPPQLGPARGCGSGAGCRFDRAARRGEVAIIVDGMPR